MSIRIDLPNKAFEIDFTYVNPAKSPEKWRLILQQKCHRQWSDTFAEFTLTDTELVALADLINEQIAGAKLPAKRFF